MIDRNELALCITCYIKTLPSGDDSRDAFCYKRTVDEVLTAFIVWLYAEEDQKAERRQQYLLLKAEFEPSLDNSDE